jgi:hypothetical protein
MLLTAVLMAATAVVTDSATAGSVSGSGLWGVRPVSGLLWGFGLLRGGLGGNEVLLFDLTII